MLIDAFGNVSNTALLMILIVEPVSSKQRHSTPESLAEKVMSESSCMLLPRLASFTVGKVRLRDPVRGSDPDPGSRFPKARGTRLPNGPSYRRSGTCCRENDTGNECDCPRRRPSKLAAARRPTRPAAAPHGGYPLTARSAGCRPDAARAARCGRVSGAILALEPQPDAPTRHARPQHS